MEQLYVFNHLAVFVSAIANLALGALWYSPAPFYKAWLMGTRLNAEQLEKANPAKTYRLAFILALVISYNLAFFLGEAQKGAVWGATAGFTLAGFGFSSLIFAIIALFEQKSWKYIFINGGFIHSILYLIGFILGVWR